ncbi:MAG TPA: hypothetical protein VJB16_01955 [archaeon]|nr:hypothetical protein [archaeon]
MTPRNPAAALQALHAAQLAIIIGIVMGFGAFFLRIALSSGFSPAALPALLASPLAWAGALFSVVGFLGMQKALSAGNASVVMPLLGGLSVLVPVALGLAFLGEAVGALKAAGIVLILVGTAGIAR